jgi:hypothetical protein
VAAGRAPSLPLVAAGRAPSLPLVAAGRAPSLPLVAAGRAPIWAYALPVLSSTLVWRNLDCEQAEGSDGHGYLDLHAAG